MFFEPHPFQPFGNQTSDRVIRGKLHKQGRSKAIDTHREKGRNRRCIA